MSGRPLSDPRILSKRSGRRARRSEPLNVYVTVRFRFGPQPEDTVTMLDRRRVPMVDSVFKARRRIARAFTGLIIKAAAMQPKVLREVVPAARLLAGLRSAHRSVKQ